MRYESGPYVCVPCTHHLKNCDGDKCGERERDHYLTEVLDIACSVNLSCKVKLVGDLHKVLSEQVNVEDTYKERNYESRITPYGMCGLVPTELCDCTIVCDGEKLTGDHHSCKKSRKHCVLTYEFESCECECGEHCDNERKKCGNDTYDKSVNKELYKLSLCKRLYVVAPLNCLGEKCRNCKSVLGKRLERRNYHPVEREDNYKSHDAEERVKSNLCQYLENSLRRGNLLHVALLHNFHVFRFRHLLLPPYINSESSSYLHQG